MLILDDFHVINNQEILEGLSFLLEHKHRQFHLVIITRADPPLSLGRLRGQSLLTELRADDLRFTSEETKAYLNDIMGLGLSSKELDSLETRTEGWIVGLTLASQSMLLTLPQSSSRPGPRTFPASRPREGRSRSMARLRTRTVSQERKRQKASVTRGPEARPSCRRSRSPWFNRNRAHPRLADASV